VTAINIEENSRLAAHLELGSLATCLLPREPPSCFIASVGLPTKPTVGAAWSEFKPSRWYSVGLEEELMLLDPADDWVLAQRIDDVLPALSPELAPHVTAETQNSVLELATGPHGAVDDATREASELRAGLVSALGTLDLRPAGAGTHPSALWHDTGISSGERHQQVYGSMRELTRREPTFGLHVHVGVGECEAAITLHNRMRAHLPLLLALSANSPYWQGRDTGLASARTPIFQAFPRVGIPRAFHSYEDYVETVDLLIRCEAFPEPTYLWWDVRPQPKFGTVEVRIMDVQTTSSATRGLLALVQSIARLELEEGYHVDRLAGTPEVLTENRFVASRDGMEARLIDPVTETRIPARTAIATLIDAARPHAEALGCADALESVTELARENGAARQRRTFGRLRALSALVASLADDF
jgi:carboxylate-amine ligase